jgi:hypothetical protein
MVFAHIVRLAVETTANIQNPAFAGLREIELLRNFLLPGTSNKEKTAQLILDG